MGFEEMLTIVLGTGVGVAVVLATVSPRQIGARSLSSASSVETITLSSSTLSEWQTIAASASEATSGRSTAAEAPAPEVHGLSFGASPVSASPTGSFGASRATFAARSNRAIARTSPTSRTRVKPGTSGGVRAARKNLD